MTRMEEFVIAEGIWFCIKWKKSVFIYRRRNRFLYIGEEICFGVRAEPKI